MEHQGRAGRELTRRGVCVCRFHSLLCYLSRASAGVVWAIVSRCVCGCSPIFPKGGEVRPVNAVSCFVHCSPVLDFELNSLTSEETVLLYVPLVWYEAFEDLEPGHLINRIGAGRIGRLASEKPGRYTLYNDAAYVGCSMGVFKVPMKLSDKVMSPRCTDLAEVQVGYGLGFVALRVKISRRAASSFAGTDG
jgi:hypothetical protein